jgi:RimJ/RimL family protein N-acetyltransferase
MEPPPARLEERVAESGTWDDHQVLLGILRDGATIGTAQALACPRTQAPGVYEVGLTLFDEADRGRGIGSETLRLLTAYLFRDRLAIRVWLTTDLDNVAMRRTSERLGFQQEGVMRATSEHDGELIDAAVYGMTRDDFAMVDWPVKG